METTTRPAKNVELGNHVPGKFGLLRENAGRKEEV